MAFNYGAGLNGPAEWAQNQQNQQQEQWQNIMQLMMAAQQEKRRQEQQVFQNQMEQQRLGEEQKRTGLEEKNYASEDAERQSMAQYRQNAANQDRGLLAQRKRFGDNMVANHKWTDEQNDKFQITGQDPGEPEREDIPEGSDLEKNVAAHWGMAPEQLRATGRDAKKYMLQGYGSYLDKLPTREQKNTDKQLQSDAQLLAWTSNRLSERKKAKQRELQSVQSIIDKSASPQVAEVKSPGIQDRAIRLQRELSDLSDVEQRLGGHYASHSARIPLTDDMRKDLTSMAGEQKQPDMGADFIGNLFDSILGKNVPGATGGQDAQGPPGTAPKGYHWVKQ